jgi:uncharacterized protein (DUF1778 family)
MKRAKRLMSPGVSRARTTEERKQQGLVILERAAAKEGVSMSRFIVERALHAAKRVL